MRFFIRRLSSVLAILGGVLFLVLPVAFLNGIVSIAPPPPAFQCHPPRLCPIFEFRPMPGDMVSFWAVLGFIGVLLGFFGLILGPRTRVGYALGLAFSLGSIAFLFWTVTSQIQRTFILTPAGFPVFPETAVMAMTGATVLFSYELARKWREVIAAITS